MLTHRSQRNTHAIQLYIMLTHRSQRNTHAMQLYILLTHRSQRNSIRVRSKRLYSRSPRDRDANQCSSAGSL